ncbi:MAG TPA: hypothetical protein VGD66_02380 [Allosphingosinicella sp.]
MRITNRRFEEQREKIDGNDYVDCHFDNTWLAYAGGDLPNFERREFTRIRIVFEGAAERTLILLQEMAKPESGFTPVFDQMFPRRPHV